MADTGKVGRRPLTALLGVRFGLGFRVITMRIWYWGCFPHAYAVTIRGAVYIQLVVIQTSINGSVFMV